LKWSQPPVEIDPNLALPAVYCGWNEPSNRQALWFDCWECGYQCHGDASCDGMVNFLDLGILKANFFTRYGDAPGYNGCADFNRDLSVDFLDVGMVMPPIWMSTVPWDCAPAPVPGGPERWEVAADDFRCLGPMPITSVHWWGSYSGWNETTVPEPNGPIAWRIGFWSNVADPNLEDPNTYSHPGELLWQVEVPNERVQCEWVGTDEFPGMAPEACFQYFVQLNPEECFMQGDYQSEDNVFWLSIVAIHPNVRHVAHPWGWKSRPASWMDAAVRFSMYGTPSGGFSGLVPGMAPDPLSVTPIKDPVNGESFDMAFELDTDVKWVKWEQPFTGIRHWPHYEDELSIAKVEPTGEPNVIRLAADDWRCEGRSPVSAITWWGSYIGYHYEACTVPAMVQPDKPDYFLLSIWIDVPADSCVPESYSHPGEKIWEYQAHEYDEVLVGHDKHPEDANALAREPVFRYSVRLPREDWFFQQDTDDIYWFSVAAVYSDINLPMVYVFVDDFELYPTDIALRAVWSFTGGGQIGIGAPPEPVHSGVRSMEFQYDTDDPWADGSPEAWAETAGSEAGADWTGFGAEVLTLWFYGDADNDANATEQMYVGLQDGSGAYAEVRYGEHGEDMNDLKNEEWQQWCIRLQEFTDRGVDLTDVQTIHIGFGDRTNPVPGGRGRVYFDDIALNDVCLRMPEHPWGWANHEHAFNDDAVAGHIDDSRAWVWEELFDQTGASADMSFILFADYDPILGTCWDNVHECGGQPYGDGNCDGGINFVDLGMLKMTFFSCKGEPPYNCCADFDHSGCVGFTDLSRLKQWFFSAGHTPATGNQDCPP